MTSADQTIADQYGIDIDPDEEVTKPVEQRWRCENDSAANWLLRKLGDVEAEIAAHEQMAADERERVTTWLRSVLAPLESKRAFFEGAACDYMRRRFEETGVITVNLPAGTLTNRLGQPTVKVLDEERFVTWAIHQERRDLLSITIKPALREMKAALESAEGRWWSPAVGDVAAAAEVDAAGELVAVVTYEGEKLTDPADLAAWEPVPDGAAVVAGVDDGPPVVVPAVTLEDAERSPKAKAVGL